MTAIYCLTHNQFLHTQKIRFASRCNCMVSNICSQAIGFGSQVLYCLSFQCAKLVFVYFYHVKTETKNQKQVNMGQK